MTFNDVMVDPPRATGASTTIRLDGRLVASEGPSFVTLIIQGDARVSVPVFATEQELREVLAYTRSACDRIQQITDGDAFRASLPGDVNVITDIRFLPNGRIRYLVVPPDHDARAIPARPIEFFVIYEGTTDFKSVVVRRWVVDGDTETPDSMPCIFAPTVERARDGLQMMRPGLVCLGRGDNDDPCIVEVWI